MYLHGEPKSAREADASPSRPENKSNYLNQKDSPQIWGSGLQPKSLLKASSSTEDFCLCGDCARRNQAWRNTQHHGASPTAFCRS